MAVIHMDTELVYNLLKKMRSTTNNLSTDLDDLVWNCRKMDWDGEGREKFLNKVNSKQKALNALFDQQDQLAFKLEREINQWIEEDYSFKYSRRDPVYYAMPIKERLYFDWIGFLIAGGDVGADVWFDLSKLGKYSKYIPIINLLLGITEDLKSGDWWLRAIGSESIELLLNLTPIIGLYSLALGITQIGFSVYGGLSGNLEYSTAALEFLEKCDFVDKFGDAVYDFVTQDPGLFANLLINPMAMIPDPDLSKFFSSFVSENFRDFGWDQGAVWLENTHELQHQLMQNFLEITPAFQIQTGVENLWSRIF